MGKSSITNIYKKDLSRNINQHLVSDAKCGVLFSAGLDSSIIAGEISNSGIEVDLFKYENDDFQTKRLQNLSWILVSKPCMKLVGMTTILFMNYLN